MNATKINLLRVKSFYDKELWKSMTKKTLILLALILTACGLLILSLRYIRGGKKSVAEEY